MPQECHRDVPAAGMLGDTYEGSIELHLGYYVLTIHRGLVPTVASQFIGWSRVSCKCKKKGGPQN